MYSKLSLLYNTISCTLNTSKVLPEIFSSISKNLTENNKHFYRFILKFSKNNWKVDELTLYDNSFADITFVAIQAFGLKRISSNAFGTSKSTIKHFNCETFNLENSLPNYNIWKALSKLTNLTVNQFECHGNSIQCISIN